MLKPWLRPLPERPRWPTRRWFTARLKLYFGVAIAAGLTAFIVAAFAALLKVLF